MINNWKRAGIGACTAAALVVGAGLAFGPAANATPTTTSPTTSTSGIGLGIDLGGLLGGGSTPTSSPSTTPSTSPSTTPSSSPSTTPSTSPSTTPSTSPSTSPSSTPTTSPSTTPTTTPTSGTGDLLGGDGSVVVNVPSGSGSGIVIVVGGTGGSTGGGTVGGTVTGTPSGGSSQQQVVLTALHATSKYPVIYPAKDGYLDGTVFALTGTASDGQQHPATGTAVLTFGSSTVRSWPITATDQSIPWDGLLNGHVVPGRYRLTATIDGAENTAMSATTTVDVSAKRLASTTKRYSSKSVSGTHAMAPEPRAGLTKGKVYLRVTSVASKVKGKQYLIFKHGTKSLKVRILNGKHTSKAILIPKSFTSFTITHTWKKGTVKIKSLKYSYTYKTLK